MSVGNSFRLAKYLDLDDDRLMIAIQGGEPHAFEGLVERYQSALLGFFNRNIRDQQFAEDLTQETLIRVFNQSWDYLPMGRFRGWMFRIARNLLIDNIRKRTNDALVRAVKGKRDDDFDALARLAGEVLPPDEKANYRELSSLVDRVLKEIPEEQRLTFIMHHFSGLTLSEVAEAMETTLPTSKSRLRLAREKLREKLKFYGVTDPKEQE